MSRMTIKVNGLRHMVQATPDTPLLYVLRTELRLHGPRFGCGLAQCGACTVLIGKQATRSCVTPVASVQGMDVTTLEGLGTPQKPHPLQTAFIDHQAAQCGYCTNAMIVGAASLLELGYLTEKSTDAQIQGVMAQYLCRCGTHYRILAAIKDAAKAIAAGKAV